MMKTMQVVSTRPLIIDNGDHVGPYGSEKNSPNVDTQPPMEAKNININKNFLISTYYRNLFRY